MTRDVPSQPLEVLLSLEPERVVAPHVGARRAEPSQVSRRLARVVDEHQLRRRASPAAPQEASLVRARVRVGVGRPRDDQYLIRLRHAHLRPRRCAGVRLQQDEPVVLLLLRHPPRHLGPVKLRLQLTHGVVVEHAARGGLVEPQRRSESPQRAAQVPRQRRRRPSVRRPRRRHEADGHHVWFRANALQRGVKLPSHHLEEPRRRDGVPGAH